MADLRFFERSLPLSISELVNITGAILIGKQSSYPIIEDVAPLESASVGDVTFIENRKYINLFYNTQASACFLPKELANRAPNGLVLLITESPRRCFAKIANAFYPKPVAQPLIDQNATISSSAVIGHNCRIDAGAFIDHAAQIGEGCRIGNNVVIGNGVKIGPNTIIGANSSVSHTEMGADCSIYPGARIGQPGFGFEMDRSGPIDMPQLGKVRIGNNVEIGANTTVDRGAGPDTVIGNGTRIDNLVQIGHNVQLGDNCIVVAHVGIAGSTKVGNNTVIGGQVGIVGHLTIGNNVQIAAKSGVTRDLSDGAIVGGAPAVPIKEFGRQVAAMKSFGRRTKKKS